MMEVKPGTDLERLAALGEPLRRSLYEYVAGQPGPVSRDHAAAALGITRHVAAFHLDRLVREELLTHSFARTGGRTGPGAGRPSKLYRRSARAFEVALPARQYELAAGLLAEAAAGMPPRDLNLVAETHGRSLGASLGVPTGRAGGRRRMRDRLGVVLRDTGYEPFDAPDGSLCLRNCPFHRLAQRFPGLVCGMNLALLQGVVHGLAAGAFEPRLEPAPNQCCVVIHQTARTRGHRSASGGLANRV